MLDDRQGSTPGARFAPLSSLGLLGGSAASVVGRPRELAVLNRALEAARSRMTCVALDGEPGIGKTRLLLTTEERAREAGFTAIAVTADEEIRGPFLIGRSIIGSIAARETGEGSAAEQPVRRALEVLAGRDEPGFESLPPDQKLLRTFDLATVALQALAAQRPLALLIDDLQWADEDSLRLLRYLVRTQASSPILMVLATRPHEAAFVSEAVTLLADLDRMRMLQRLRLARFSQLESTEFLQEVLGGPVNLSTAAIMHAQAEGVPFILEEQARTYREAGLIQQVDAAWTLARNAQRLMPSAVRTLIERRASRLDAEAAAALAEAAVLGRSFSLRDVADLRRHLASDAPGLEPSPEALAELLAPAAALGLLAQHTGRGPADYSFTHDNVREHAAGTLAPARRRTIHAAIVSMLTAGGEPSPEGMALVARHALAAGQDELCVQMSIRAARTALEASAPEEVLRLVEVAQPVASDSGDRIALLCLRDDALGMLRRPAQRLEGLAELAALADALGDAQLQLDVLLRRAAALRLSGDYDVAATIARRVREGALELGDEAIELAACMELGQDLLRTELGEGSTLTPKESDLDGAAEAFARAVALAEALGDDRALADATRELGVIAFSRLRVWFVGAFEEGVHVEVLQQITAGVRFEELLAQMPVYPLIEETMAHYSRALELYERLGDRRGTMSTIIAMATASWAPDIHLAGSVQHLEEIRRLFTRVKAMTRESERALAEAQMLYGSHVYARTRLFVDTAVTKGEEAYQAARAFGDRGLEFAAAGGVALEHARLEAVDEAERWLRRAAEVASDAPTPVRARQLEAWRAAASWAALDPDGVRRHLDGAIAIAAEHGISAARCCPLSQRAIQLAWLGAELKDDALLEEAERAAREVQEVLPTLRGRPLWGIHADAALARIALHRGHPDEAADIARSALATFDAMLREELPLEMLLPLAEAQIVAGTPEEQEAARDRLRLVLALVAQRIADEDVRVRWFRTRLGRELTRLAGPLERLEASSQRPEVPLDAGESDLLRLVTEGRTNREIAEELALSEDSVSRQLAVLFAKIGAATRSEATIAAMVGKLV